MTRAHIMNNDAAYFGLSLLWLIVLVGGATFMMIQ
jgi:hypothetical protein